MEKKMNKWSVEWPTLPLQDAAVKVEQLRQELFALRLGVRFSHNPLFSTNQRALKKEIARGLTYISQVLNAAERVQ
ncbi:MAG: hypothetical protein UU47_C0001G0067 [candidate division TM6 bacterium GW2011_GWE2_41_16]|nr:MAG: hypothetical protein UU47_C0001G0067 [candidate division TM6 bacterium GW2011_GWE2_41_16]